MRGLLLCGWLVLGCAWAQVAERPVLTVALVEAASRPHARSLAADGEVAAREMAAVNAQVAGVALRALHADVGDAVRAGQVLAEFDDVLLKHELAQAQAALARGEAALQLAKANAARARKLLKDKAISQQDADALLAGEREALAAIEGARAARDMAQLRLAYAQARSPVDGVVVARPAVVGMMGAVGAPLFSLMVDGALEWRAQVAPEALSVLSVGSEALVSVGGAQVKGKVVKFAPVAEAQSRLLTVFVALEADARVRAGMLVRGKFLLGEETVVTVPASAVVREDGYDFVMLVGEDARVRRQALRLGERIGDAVVVLEGLPEGARMVAQGGAFLQDGDLVRVAE